VLELVGQLRLFEHGLDSADLPPEHPAVEKLQRKLEKKKSDPLERSPRGKLTAARRQVARLLNVLNDPLADELIALGETGSVRADSRNDSILVHGFRATSVADDAELRALYASLEALLIEDGGPAATDRLALARSLDLSSRLTGYGIGDWVAVVSGQW
jgi:hypothetical protein